MPDVTKSRRKLDAWAEIRDLDRLAMPLIGKYGIERAYQMAVDGVEEETSAAASSGAVPRETLRAREPECF